MDEEFEQFLNHLENKYGAKKETLPKGISYIQYNIPIKHICPESPLADANIMVHVTNTLWRFAPVAISQVYPVTQPHVFSKEFVDFVLNFDSTFNTDQCIVFELLVEEKFPATFIYFTGNRKEISYKIPSSYFAFSPSVDITYDLKTKQEIITLNIPSAWEPFDINKFDKIIEEIIRNILPLNSQKLKDLDEYISNFDTSYVTDKTHIKIDDIKDNKFTAGKLVTLTQEQEDEIAEILLTNFEKELRENDIYSIISNDAYIKHDLLLGELYSFFLDVLGIDIVKEVYLKWKPRLITFTTSPKTGYIDLPKELFSELPSVKIRNGCGATIRVEEGTTTLNEVGFKNIYNGVGSSKSPTLVVLPTTLAQNFEYLPETFDQSIAPTYIGIKSVKDKDGVEISPFTISSAEFELNKNIFVPVK